MQYIKWLSNFVKNRWQVILIVILAIISLFLYTKQPKTIIISKDNTDLYTKLKYYEDQNGVLVAQTIQQNKKKSEVEARVDSLSKELKISKKNIKIVDRWNLKTDTTFITKSSSIYINKDTAYKVEKHDDYLNIVAVAGKDTGYIYFSHVDTLDRIEKSRYKFLGLIGSSKTDVLIRAKSPYTKIQSGYSFSVSEPIEILTLGPSITYDIFNKKIILGVSVQVPIIKIYKPRR